MTEPDQSEREEFLRNAAAAIDQLEVISGKLKLAPGTDAKTIGKAIITKLEEQAMVCTPEQMKALKRICRHIPERSDREEMEELLQNIEEGEK